MKTTLDRYLGERGLSSPVSDFLLDKLRLPHGQTIRQQKRMERDHHSTEKAYTAKRQAAIAEYMYKVTSGEIQEMSKLEQTMARASGHPDNPSVQAAKRRLAKLMDSGKG